jgi:hypothetical protein
VHILTAQEGILVFDVKKSFHIKNGFITKDIYKNSKATNIFIPVTLLGQKKRLAGGYYFVDFHTSHNTPRAATAVSNG